MIFLKHKKRNKNKMDFELLSSATNSLTEFNQEEGFAKGILAADESIGTMGKRLADIGLENTVDNRKNFRELLVHAPGIEKYIGGVIFCEETFGQSDSEGRPFIKILKDRGIAVGIKLDGGLTNMGERLCREQVTRGLDVGDPLSRKQFIERARVFRERGADFAKWRCVFKIDKQNNLPSSENVRQNCRQLSIFAKTCQLVGLVPMVEPEILMEGSHDYNISSQAHLRVLNELVYTLNKDGCYLAGMLIKTSMITTGADYEMNEEEKLFRDLTVGYRTSNCLLKVIPPAMGGIVFLSGGQSLQEVCENLKKINGTRNWHNWALSYSFGRALQKTVLEKWSGSSSNVEEAQKILLDNARLCSESTIYEEPPQSNLR